jgi:hypothetical protein
MSRSSHRDRRRGFAALRSPAWVPTRCDGSGARTNITRLRAKNPKAAVPMVTRIVKSFITISLLPVYRVLHDPDGTVRHDRTRMIRTIVTRPRAAWRPLRNVDSSQDLHQACAPGMVQKPYRVLSAQRTSRRLVIVCSPAALCPAYIIPSRAKKVHRHPRGTNAPRTTAQRQ